MDEVSAAAVEYPPGEFAIVELFGHTPLVGRVTEVERQPKEAWQVPVAIRCILPPDLLPAPASAGLVDGEAEEANDGNLF